MKSSPGKVSWPGAKQVFRQFEADGLIARDIIAGVEEKVDGTPLLETVLAEGELLPGYPQPLYDQVTRSHEMIAALPNQYRDLEPAATFPVEFTDYLRCLRTETLKKVST